MNHVAAILTPVLLLLLPSLASAQNEHLVGRKVMTVKWDVEFKEGNKVVFESELGTVYEVDRVNGQWFLLVGNGRKGWVKRSDVVPYEQAIDHFNRLLHQSPTSTGYYHRALAWKAKGELDIALSDMNEAIRRDPSASAYFNSRGNLWKAKGEYERAIADYNEAIRLDPKCATAYRGRGNTWKARGQFDRAIADYNEAIRVDPSYADAYNSRAWLLATCPEAKYRNGPIAVNHATKACELTSWGRPADIDTLAAAYAEKGDFPNAVGMQKKAIEGFSKEEAKRYGLYSRLRLYEVGKPYREEEK